MRPERPETCFWLNFAIISEHFAGKVGGSDVASLKKILGMIIMKKLEYVHHGKGTDIEILLSSPAKTSYNYHVALQ
jgi:hypothetical protein